MATVLFTQPFSGIVQTLDSLVEYKKERHILNAFLVPDRYFDLLPPYFDGSISMYNFHARI